MRAIKLTKASTIVLKAGTVVEVDEATLATLAGRYELVEQPAKATPAKSKKG